MSTKEELRLRDRVRHWAVRNVSIETAVCEVCGEDGAENDLQRHHPDYGQREWVMIVCRPCHLKIHGKRQPTDYELWRVLYNHTAGILRERTMMRLCLSEPLYYRWLREAKRCRVWAEYQKIVLPWP